MTGTTGTGHARSRRASGGSATTAPAAAATPATTTAAPTQEGSATTPTDTLTDPQARATHTQGTPPEKSEQVQPPSGDASVVSKTTSTIIAWEGKPTKADPETVWTRENVQVLANMTGVTLEEREGKLIAILTTSTATAPKPDAQASLPLQPASPEGQAQPVAPSPALSSEPPATTAPTPTAPEDPKPDTDALAGITGLSFSRAGDVDTSDMNYMILVYGDSGSGKTHLGSNCDGVIVALLEPQGFATVRVANPDAIVAGDPDPTITGKPRWLKNMEQVRNFFQAAASGRFRKAGCKTILLDSATELQQMFIDEIVAEKKKRAQPTAQPVQGRTPGKAATPPPRAPATAPEKEKGPAPEMTKQDWGTLAVKWRNFMRMLRGLPYNVIVLALSEPTQDEGTGRRLMFPKLSGSAQAALPAYFNICTYLYKATVEGEVVRLCLVDGDDRFYTKSFGPIKGIVDADLRQWFAALAGAEADLHVEGAKPPGGSTTGSGRPHGGTATQAPAQESVAGADTSSGDVQDGPGY